MFWFLFFSFQNLALTLQRILLNVSFHWATATEILRYQWHSRSTFTKTAGQQHGSGATRRERIVTWAKLGQSQFSWRAGKVENIGHNTETISFPWVEMNQYTRGSKFPFFNLLPGNSSFLNFRPLRGCVSTAIVTLTEPWNLTLHCNSLLNCSGKKSCTTHKKTVL